MTFAAKVLQDMQDTFLNTAEFAEAVTYIPSGGEPVTIYAVVERAPINPIIDRGQGYSALNTHIWISRDSTPGIGIGTVKERFDKVALKAKLTDVSDTTFIVKKMFDHDMGGWHLELEA